MNGHWILSKSISISIIGENETQDIYRLNLANYQFGLEQFSDCLDNIPATSPFVVYMLHGKRLELKALFELRSELLPYKLDAFKMFLRNGAKPNLSKTAFRKPKKNPLRLRQPLPPTSVAYSH